MRITDREVLGLIVGRYKTPAAAAQALGLGHKQFFYNWRARGIPRGWRRTLWMLCKERGIHFDEAWCIAGKSRQERAALARSLRSVARTSNGATNGKAGRKRKTGSKPRQRPAQRQTLEAAAR